MNTTARYVLTIVCMTNTILFSGGLIYGWGPVASMLYEEGQFRHSSCDPDPSVACSPQEAAVGNIQYVAFNSLSVMSMVFGICVDYFGPRLCTMAGLTMSFFGNIMFAYADASQAEGALFSIGLSFIVGGGIAPFLCHFNFSQVFPERHQGLFISFVNGSFNLSGAIYMLLSLESVTRKTFFLCYAGLAVLGFIATLLTYPRSVCANGKAIDSIVAQMLQQGPVADYEQLLANESYVEVEDNDSIPEKQESNWSLFKVQARSTTYIWLVIWYAFVLLLLPITNVSVSELLKGGRREHVADFYLNVLSPIVSNMAFLFAPLSGFLIRYAGFTPSFFVSSFSGCAALMLSSVPLSNGYWVQIFTFVFQSLQKGFMFNTFYSFLALAFPIQINGLLVALATFAAAVVGFASLGFNALVHNGFHGKYFFPNLILIAAILPSWVFLYYSKQADRKMKLQG